MKFIARNTDYAMRALIFMAKRSGKIEEDVVTVDEIVHKSGLPRIFLRRILQTLANKKILSSYKGKEGGFSFLKSPRQIHLADIMEIFQGKIDITNCLLKGRVCPNRRTCILRKKLKRIGQLMDKELEKITITSLSRGVRSWQKEGL